MDGFSKFKRQMFRIDKSDNKKLFSLKIYFRSDGKRLFAHYMRTNRRIFESLTASVQIWAKWWWKMLSLKIYFRFWREKAFWSYPENNRQISKFKRHNNQVWSKWWRKMLSLKIYFRFGRENVFSHNITKFKRHMFRFDRSDDGKCCRWKSTSGLDEKRLFVSYTEN